LWEFLEENRKAGGRRIEQPSFFSNPTSSLSDMKRTTTPIGKHQYAPGSEN